MIEIAPIDALALSLHHSPGVQALLIGSGVSRSAGVPTGWEITLDLIRRLAEVQGEQTEANITTWYQKKYGHSPDYSDLLDSIASTPAERRSIIHSYIEGNAEDAPRQPTLAHNSIAKLISSNHIRLVITTNFDRLLERSLHDIGISPTVIASEDALSGAPPLIHSQCTIVKLHGDYMDARIRNTQDELISYGPLFESMLDRIFDEFGLVVAGWSGDWDTALRNAILRSPNRRYPFYWASRGTVCQMGTDLVNHRLGKTIAIDDADTFFSQLTQKVQALSSLKQANPSSISMAIAHGKRTCRDDRLVIEWSDLLANEVSKFSSYVKSPNFHPYNPTKESLNQLIRDIIARSECLRRLVLIGTRWGTAEAFQSVLSAIDALTFSDLDRSGFSWVVGLRRLGASLCFYWSLSAAFMREDFARVARLMHMHIQGNSDEHPFAVQRLPFQVITPNWSVLDGLEAAIAPHSTYFSGIFLTESKDISMSEAQANRAWDSIEFLICAEYFYWRLSSNEQFGMPPWGPFGKFCWQRSDRSRKERLDYLNGLFAGSPEIRAGLFGGSVLELQKITGPLAQFLDRIGGFGF